MWASTCTHSRQCSGSTPKRLSRLTSGLSRSDFSRSTLPSTETAAEPQAHHDQVSSVRALFAVAAATLHGKANMLLLEVLVFPEERRSDHHLQRILNLLGSAVDSIHMSMYMLTHVGVPAALLAAKAKAPNIDIAIIVDNTMVYCSGSMVKRLLAGSVTIYVDCIPSFIQHHKYVLIDDRLTIRGSVNLIQHTMVSAGILTIHEDMRMVEPLARHFVNVSDSTIYRCSTRGATEDETMQSVR